MKYEKKVCKLRYKSFNLFDFTLAFMSSKLHVPPYLSKEFNFLTDFIFKDEIKYRFLGSDIF